MSGNPMKTTFPLQQRPDIFGKKGNKHFECLFFQQALAAASLAFPHLHPIQFFIRYRFKNGHRISCVVKYKLYTAELIHFSTTETVQAVI